MIGFTFFLFLICAGCTRPITGKIVDAETGQPIEGAILLVEWSKVHGFGNTYTFTERAVEVFSNKNGLVNIPGYDDPTAQSPEVTIYKPGYVAWNSKWLFPDMKNRTDFKWKDGYVFKLEKFKANFSYDSHTSFLSGVIGTGLIDHKTNIKKAIMWEEEKAFKEREANRSK